MLTPAFQNGHGRLEDKKNLFTAMRIGFALVILAGHSIQIPHGLPLAPGGAQFLDAVVQRCLDGFFILSGYMITASALRSNDLVGYTLSRVLRIAPGLIAATLLLWLVVGPLFTSLSFGEYWSQGQTWAFPVMLLSQADPMAGLPGVFDGSPQGYYANGPLWTIRYEIMAYVGVGALMMTGLFRNRFQVLSWVLLAMIGSVAYATFGYSGIGDDTIGTLARFAPAFLIGGGIYVLRDEFTLSPALIALSALAAFMAAPTVLGPVMLQVATALTVVWLGFVRLPRAMGKPLEEIEDVSYGVYILHWPIGQMLFALNPGFNSLTLFALMVPLAIFGGWVMRVLVEKPALSLRRPLKAALGRRTTSAAATS